MQIQIKINPEYESICPPLNNREFESLKQSIRNYGLYEAITISKNGTILDGHHRYRICKELGIIPRFKEKDFPDELDEKRYVIETNLERRQLSKLERAELGLKIEELEAEKAKNKKERLRSPETGRFNPSCSNGQNGQIHARDFAAKKVRLSPITYHRAKTILEKESDELINRVRNGQCSITYAYKKINRREKHRNPPELPQGEYDVIYADPPWDYYLPLRADPEMHYSVLSIDQICSLDVPSSSDSILFLWATNPKLENALKVINEWGFNYKTNLAWIKDKIGTGYYFRAKHELLLIATKGKIPPPVEENRPPSVLFSPREEHSKKPEQIYDFIELMYPNRKYIELFARNQRENWTSWGDEL